MKRSCTIHIYEKQAQQKKTPNIERTHDKQSNVYSIDLPPAYSHVSYGKKN